MRILLVSNLYPPHALGGAEIVASDIATGLKRLGHEVHVLTSSYGLTRPETDGQVRRTLRIAPPVHFDRRQPLWKQFGQLLNYYRRYHNAANAKELRQTITTIQPDILFLNEITGIGVISLLAALHEVHLPIVFYLQSYLLIYARSPETKESHLRARWLKKLLIGSLPPLTYTSLAAVSNAVRQEYIRAGFAPESIEVVYNGVDARFLKPLPVKSYQATTEQPRTELLYVGRLNTEKGILVILKALDILVNQRSRKSLHLNIFGDGDKSYIAELQHFITEKQLADVITFHGRVSQDELIAYYDRSDIMLVPSLWQEPFALVTAEGMARGLPIIASKVGGTGERITDNVNGLLVEPGDEQAVASAILQLTDNPDTLQRISQAARSTIEEHFTVEKCAKHMEQHLLKALQK